MPDALGTVRAIRTPNATRWYTSTMYESYPKWFRDNVDLREAYYLEETGIWNFRYRPVTLTGNVLWHLYGGDTPR